MKFIISLHLFVSSDCRSPELDDAIDKPLDSSESVHEAIDALNNAIPTINSGDLSRLTKRFDDIVQAQENYTSNFAEAEDFGNKTSQVISNTLGQVASWRGLPKAQRSTQISNIQNCVDQTAVLLSKHLETGNNTKIVSSNMGKYCIDNLVL